MTLDRPAPVLSLVGRRPLRVAGSPDAAASSAATAATGVAQTAGVAAVMSPVDAIAARTVQILRRAGIQSIVLNGAGVGRTTMPSASGRRHDDVVDLLVAPWAQGAAELLLRHHRYGRRPQEVQADGHVRDRTVWSVPERPGTVLHLHNGLPGVGDPDRFFTEMWRSRRLAPLGDVDVPVPGAGGAALLLLLRAAAPGLAPDVSAEICSAAEMFEPAAWVRAGVLARLVDAAPAAAVGAAVIPAGAVTADVPTESGSPSRRTWLGMDTARAAVAAVGPVRTGAGSARHAVQRALPLLRTRFRTLG